ncbi:MAG: PilZ domain-containing protein [Acidobacteria bacterium]|nr:PilZ domain-containing protein [Acidobacteriota bacterium]
MLQRSRPAAAKLRPGQRIDRRATVRYPCHLKTTCHPLTTEQTGWVGEVVNLSAGGVGLLLPQPFKTRTVLVVELHGARPAFTRELLARVVHVRKKADGRWLIGCAFASLLRDKELKAVLDGGLVLAAPEEPGDPPAA